MVSYVVKVTKAPRFSIKNLNHFLRKNIVLGVDQSGSLGRPHKIHQIVFYIHLNHPLGQLYREMQLVKFGPTFIKHVILIEMIPSYDLT